jgi:hypothetical protein
MAHSEEGEMTRLTASFLLALVAGCATTGGGGPAYMTEEEVGAYGSHSYAAPGAKVFTAVVSALKSEGYEIAVENQEKGIVRTGRKMIRAAAAGGYGYAQAVAYTRQYMIDVRTKPDGQILVVARPRVFAGEQDLSANKVWVLEGDQGERRLWNNLFQEIGELL